MEEALLGGREEEKWRATWRAFWEELKMVSYIAVPMVAVMVSQYLSQVILLMMVGHLGELALSGIAIASSVTNVTGFSFVFGMAGALETLCGQAYGAQQYQKLGTYTNCSMVSIIPVCIPICFLWIFMDQLLVLLGQDFEVAMLFNLAYTWIVYLSISPVIIRYFQCQGLIPPMFLSSCAALCLHIPVCWILLHKTNLGIIGAALSTGLSFWFNVVLLGIYMRYSSSCDKSRALIFNDIFLSIKEFFSFALPSAVMFLVIFSFIMVIVVLSGGHLRYLNCYQDFYQIQCLRHQFYPYGKLLNHLTTTSFHYLVPYGISAAASNEKEVVNYVREMIPILCISVIMDSVQAVLSGVARGTGLQHIGAYVNLGAYYLLGVPVAVVLCFALNLRGKGLWIGILAGSTVQASLLALVTGLTNWQKQASNARERMLEGSVPANNESA
ncbi:Multi antimicrobial extrusion protein - like 10 [Theobroma cacao]|nr:Multi antimicrobial extrusion protein - like 10 [Theobroma cacao]